MRSGWPRGLSGRLSSRLSSRLSRGLLRRALRTVRRGLPRRPLQALFMWGGLIMTSQAAVDIDALWDFDRPAVSEQRFRDALATAAGGPDGPDGLVLRTQIARTHSLRGQFEQAHRELDAIEPRLPAAGPEVQLRAALERGRTLRSAGQPLAARPHFERAVAIGEAAGLESLTADALHMVALVEPTVEGQLAWNRRVVALARAARDPAARRWEAIALNNMGVTLNQAGRYDEALAVLQDALAARRAANAAPGRVRVAQWMVAHTLRLLGRNDEALALQLALEQELQQADETDAYVFEELALLYAARGDDERSHHYRNLHRQAAGS